MTDTSIPDTMFAVVLKENGYSAHAEGPVIDDASVYLHEAKIPVPEPAKGQVLIKLRTSSV